MKLNLWDFVSNWRTSSEKKVDENQRINFLITFLNGPTNWELKDPRGK